MSIFTPSVIGPELPRPETAQRRRAIQVLAVVALTVGVAYLVWRACFTLNLDAWWLSIPLLLLEAWGLAGLGLFAFSLWDVDSLGPPEPVEDSDLRLAVLIPTYSEDIEVLLPTVAAAVAMRLAHETWVLDDGDRAEIASLADDLGARYLARPTHEHAKAGNLNHALEQIDADIVAIFDADHVPDPDFFVQTLGYFEDPAVAIVQTPQDFYNIDSFEHLGLDSAPAWDRQPVHEETLFYRVVQPAKNRWAAAFWCGTNAAVRVAALRTIGGVPTETVTEDIHATVRFQQQGWRAVYHNEVLARGLAAADAEQFRLQRNRWATGAMQLLRTDNPFTVPGLTLRQRLGYAATIGAWFDAWRSLGFLLIPPIVLLTGASPIATPLLTFVIVFGIAFTLQQLALSALSRGYHRPFASARFELTRLGSTLAATLTLFASHARQFKVTPKGRQGNRRERGRVPLGLWLLLALELVSGAWFVLTIQGLTPLHYGVLGVAWGAFFWLLFNGVLVASAAWWIHSARHASELRRSVRFPLAEPALIDGTRCTVRDCSLGGARLEFDDPAVARGVLLGPVRRLLDLQLAGSALPLAVELRTLRASRDGTTEVGVEFAPDQAPALGALATMLFQGSVAPVFGVALVGDAPVDWQGEATLAAG